MNDAEMMVFLMTLMIFAGVAVLWMAMQSRRRLREMEHRERLAMIERGLIPPPELDPAGFERRAGVAGASENPASNRARSAGVMMIGFGLGLMVLIAFAFDTPGVGLGLGGAFALLGAAFLVNGMLASRNDPYAPADTRLPPRYERRDPPPSVGP